MKPVALVTGGQQGIGLGIAETLAEAGFALAIASERADDDPAVTAALALVLSAGCSGGDGGSADPPVLQPGGPGDEATPASEEDIDAANMAEDAPLINLVDNTARIDELLAAYNEQNGEPGEDGGEDAGLEEDDGCACNVDGRNTAGGMLFGFMSLGLFGLVRRRR